MLVSAKEMLEKARDGKYAVGQFNINNLEWTKAILLTAQEMNSPVILGVSCGAGKYMTGFKTVASMVSAMIDDLKITVPVALHLDHGTYEACYDCINAVITSFICSMVKVKCNRNSNLKIIYHSTYHTCYSLKSCHIFTSTTRYTEDNW